MADYTMVDTDPPVIATVTFLDALNNETVPDSTPVWTEDDPNEAIVPTVAEDGMSASIAASGVGVGTITVTAGSITASATIEVTAGTPQSATITVEPGA